MCLEFRIKLLGGEVDLSARWNPACSHVITLNFEYFHEKVINNLTNKTGTKSIRKKSTGASHILQPSFGYIF